MIRPAITCHAPGPKAKAPADALGSPSPSQLTFKSRSGFEASHDRSDSGLWKGRVSIRDGEQVAAPAHSKVVAQCVLDNAVDDRVRLVIV